jgi:hypothetical protein
MRRALARLLAVASASGLAAQERTPPAYVLQRPAGYSAGDWAPLVVLVGGDETASRALSEKGFVVASPREPASLGEPFGKLLDALRRDVRIAQGGMHAAFGGDGERALAAVLRQRHQFQTITVFGAAAGIDLSAVRRLHARRVHAVEGGDPEALAKHLLALHREREQDGAAGDAHRTLDSFHDAAAIGDEDRYFAILPDDSVFLGTDATERWTGAEFRAFALPYFERESAWTYVPLRRFVTLAPCGDVAWFDEVLDNAGYGECRGSGVLVRRGERWVVRQYNLTVPVPNDLLRDVAEQIRAHADGRTRR